MLAWRTRGEKRSGETPERMERLSPFGQKKKARATRASFNALSFFLSFPSSEPRTTLFEALSSCESSRGKREMEGNLPRLGRRARVRIWGGVSSKCFDSKSGRVESGGEEQKFFFLFQTRPIESSRLLFLPSSKHQNTQFDTHPFQRAGPR